MESIKTDAETQPAEISEKISSEDLVKESSTSVIIYCCSGSGNSLWGARQVAKRLERDVKILPVPLVDGSTPKTSVMASTVGFVFPVHAWAPPRRLRHFVRTLDLSSVTDAFALATHAGQPARALALLHRDLCRAGLARGLRVGMNLRMPSNFGKTEPSEACRNHIALALEKIGQKIVPSLRSKEAFPLEQGSLLQRGVLSTLNPVCVPGFGVLGRFFFADKKCTKCGLCAQLCPRKNITMTETGPQFGRDCELCVACLQWCPLQAIQYSKQSQKNRRYVHPDVSLKGFLEFHQRGEVVRENDLVREKY